MKLSLSIFYRLGLRSLTPSKSLIPLSLMSLISLGGVNWLVISTITPKVAQAYTAQTEVTLTAQPGESFQTLVQRAEAVARAATQRLFDRDISVTDVDITILGQNDGQIVPLLNVEVSRQAWRTQPEVSYWATYFTNASTLLQFGQTTTVESQPTAPSTIPTQTPAAFDADDPEVQTTPANVDLGIEVIEGDRVDVREELETETLEEEVEEELETETLEEEAEEELETETLGDELGLEAEPIE